MPSKRKIVIAVDDEPDNLDLIVRILSRYDVRPFTDPRVALESAKTVKPVAIVVDYRMPGMNGLELVRRCRESGVDSAILMVTAFPELDELAYAAQEELLYQIIPKPYRPERLRDWMKLAVMKTRMERRSSEETEQ